MKMAALLMARVSVGKCLTESVTHMILSWLEKNLLMTVRKVCSLLVHFLVISLSLMLCLRMSHPAGAYHLCCLSCYCYLVGVGVGVVSQC